MNSKTIIAIAIVGILVVAAGAAIILNNNNNNTKEKDDSGSSDNYYPITVTDGIGNQVTLNAEPKRIVASNQGMDLMSWMGPKYLDRIVGCPSDYAAHLDWWYAPNVYDFSKVATLVTSDDMYKDGENIIKLKPDLVFIYGGSATATANANKLVEQLGKLDIPVFVINNDSSQYKTAESYIERNFIPLTKLFNEEKRGKELYDQIMTWTGEIQEKLSGVTEANKKYVYVAGGAGKAGTNFFKSSWSTFLPSSILDKYMYNIMHDFTDDEVKELSPEDLYNYEKNTHKIDTVFVCSKVFPVWSGQVKENKNVYTAISAVSDGEIYGIPQTMARTPEATIIDTYAIACYLYPELFNGFDLEKFAESVYQAFMNDEAGGTALYKERLDYAKTTVGMTGLFQKIDMDKF